MAAHPLNVIKVFMAYMGPIVQWEITHLQGKMGMSTA